MRASDGEAVSAWLEHVAVVGIGIERCTEAGCEGPSAGIRVVSPAVTLLGLPLQVLRTAGCAIALDEGALEPIGSVFLEGNLRGLCGLRAPQNMAVVFAENEADLVDAAGETSCATEASRDCGTPFVP